MRISIRPLVRLAKWWHNGQTGGYHSMLFVSRELRAGVVVLSNSPALEVDALGETIIRLIAGIEAEPIAIPGATVDESVVRRLVGRYELVPGFVLNVTASGKRLFLQATGQQQLTLVPQSETKWTIVGVDAMLEFELPQEGHAPAMKNWAPTCTINWRMPCVIRLRCQPKVMRSIIV